MTARLNAPALPLIFPAYFGEVLNRVDASVVAGVVYFVLSHYSSHPNVRACSRVIGRRITSSRFREAWKM